MSMEGKYDAVSNSASVYKKDGKLLCAMEFRVGEENEMLKKFFVLFKLDFVCLSAAFTKGSMAAHSVPCAVGMDFRKSDKLLISIMLPLTHKGEF